jgi:iron complex outermembrane receptor protein
MKSRKYLLLCCCAFMATPALAEDAADNEQLDSRTIIVTGEHEVSAAATKTNTPAIEVPQPVTVVTSDVFQAQGAISVSDTLNYVAGIQAEPYGPDSRVDGGYVRGVDALQFRDGMRDLYSYYASIRSDPYNFSQVELIRGPASVLFGAGSLGGIINLVSKVPQFQSQGEISLRYGSYDRKEVLADVTGPLSDTLAVRAVARVRDGGSQTDHVPDDRVMFAPSIKWAPDMDTDITLLGLYQEDDGGSTTQFLPMVGTIFDNPNGKLKRDLFVGKPGWDCYCGRLLEGTAIASHRFGDHAKLSLKARYIDSDLTYFTHYPDSYWNPTNPYVQLDANGQPVTDANGQPVTDANGNWVNDPEMRHIGLYNDGSYARMNVFSTDNNLVFDFNTGAAVTHTVLAGVDYSWNEVWKQGGFGEEFIDIYDIDYAALSNFGGAAPSAGWYTEDTKGSQLGFYVQDQIRLWDRVSVVVGARHDHVTARSVGSPQESWNNTSFRAGIIGEAVKGVSPFFSYTESFEPLTGMGLTSTGTIFRPQKGRQFEAGVKVHPDDATIATLTVYDIKQTNRPVDDPDTADPFDLKQAGELTSRGIEFEASRMLPGNIELIGAISYNKAQIDKSGTQVDDVPKVNASLWSTRTFKLGGDARLRLGGGVRYMGSHRSYGVAYPDGVLTPDVTLVDALAEVSWQRWSFSLNATNLFDKRYYSACLARGDCFFGSTRNVFGTLTYKY